MCSRACCRYVCPAEVFASTYELVPGTTNRYRKNVTVLARRMTEAFRVRSKTGLQRGTEGDMLVQV